VSGGLEEFYHKVHAQDILLCFWDQKRVKLIYWRILSKLCLQAEITGANILSNILEYLEPPVVPEYELQSLLLAEIFYNLCIIIQ